MIEVRRDTYFDEWTGRASVRFGDTARLIRTLLEVAAR
jgi:hypothetical protein